MTSPLPLPDWVPWWVHLVLLLAILLFALLFLLMPFSVFGLKARIDILDARLDEIQAEIRGLAMRLPEAYDPPDMADDDGYDRGPLRPPIPPAGRRPPARGPGGRTEPRLY